MSWTPVAEGLPETGATVLVIECSGAPPESRTVARYLGPPTRLMETAWADPWGEYIDVSHWMPLPEPPK